MSATQIDFGKRLEKFSGEAKQTQFNLALVDEALDIISELNDQNVGGETVEERIGEYKSWDPEIFKVDKDTEDAVAARLKEQGSPVIMLSEEVGRIEINTDAAGKKFFVVCDPFDGSYLFKRGIPDFWYSSVSFYDEDFNCISCVVGDAVQRNVAFADSTGAYIAELGASGFEHKFKLNAEYRKSMGRAGITDLEKASIESYAMKPKKFLLPIVDNYRTVLEPFKFFLPNGGPYGFADVAEGKIDVYFAPKQPFVDIFSGINIAEQAGVVVTDFDGNKVKCSDNVKSVHDVVVSENPTLHEQVLAKIAQCK